MTWTQFPKEEEKFSKGVSAAEDIVNAKAHSPSQMGKNQALEILNIVTVS